MAGPSPWILMVSANKYIIYGIYTGKILTIYDPFGLAN